jgi:hypothetical protein
MTLAGSSFAHQAVYVAIKNRTLPKITDDIKCVDCGNPAQCYDHRDYNYPKK